MTFSVPGVAIFIGRNKGENGVLIYSLLNVVYVFIEGSLAISLKQNTQQPTWTEKVT